MVPSQDKIIDNKFHLKSKISSGSFGEVYCAIDLEKKDYIAIKLDKAKESNKVSTLTREAKFIQKLKKVKGIPKLIASGVFNQRVYLALPLLGRDLAYFLKKSATFTLKTTTMIALQVLDLLENMHSKSVLHRDIKPENIILGRGKELKTLYLIDFGISKIFRDPEGRHLKFRKKKDFIGTSRYASIASHKGEELSRKDDLESLGYMLVFLMKGYLPWQKISFTEENKIKSIGRMKETMSNDDLCSNMPEEFISYFEYVKHLGFYERPDYQYLRRLFIGLTAKYDISIDFQWDWMQQDPVKEWKTEDFKNNSLFVSQELKDAKRRTSLASSRKLSKFELFSRGSLLNMYNSSENPSCYDSQYKEEDGNF